MLSQKGRCLRRCLIGALTLWGCTPHVLRMGCRPFKVAENKGEGAESEAGHPEEQGSLPGGRSLGSPEVLAQPPAAFPARDGAPCRHLPSRARGRFSAIWVNTISKSNRNPNLPSFYKFSSTDGTISKDRGAKLGSIFFSSPI